MGHNTPKAATTHPSQRSGYVGPSAARIAEQIATQQRVRFERGWFWTGAICHESKEDLAAFRQRPDGDGIDVRCRSANCSRERIIRSLEWLTGESIWSAYGTARTEPRATASSSSHSPADESAETGGNEGTGGRFWRLAFLPFIGVLVMASFILGFELEVAALSALGYGWVGWLAHRAVVTHRRAAAAAARGGRTR